jgi:hypothetical protein
MITGPIARLVAAREGRPATAAGVLVAVVLVSLIRAALELSVCAQPRFLPASYLLNSVSFYLMAAYLYAAVGARLSGRAVDRTLSVVLPWLGLGALPPLLDLALLGIGRCRYVDPFELGGWGWPPWNPAPFTPGEAITVWLSIGVFTAYVAAATGSPVRTLLAALAGGVIAVVHAVGLSALVAWAFERWVRPALDQQAGAAGGDYAWRFRLALLTAAQSLVAQLALLASRPGLPRHLGARLLHGLPFVLLVVLGGVLAGFRGRSGWDRVDGLGLVAVAAIAIADLCLIGIVQNDHFDAGDDRGRGGIRIARDDATALTAAGFVAAGALAFSSERIGVPLLLFATASVGYNFGSVRLKQRFPANYAVEALLATSCFVLGVQARMALGRPPSRALLVSTVIVFCGWFVFNAFKDYKDIRADVRAGTPTLYALAHLRGFRLRRVHLALRGLLVIGMMVPLVGLSSLGLPVLPLAAVGIATILPAFVTLGRAPHARTVRRLLWLVSFYVAALALVTAAFGPGP